MSESKIIDIEGTKIMVCGEVGHGLPESDMQALREFIQYRKQRALKKKTKTSPKKHSKLK